MQTQESVRALVDSIRIEVRPPLKFAKGRDLVSRVLYGKPFSQAMADATAQTLNRPTIDAERVQRLSDEFGLNIMAIAVIAKTKIE